WSGNLPEEVPWYVWRLNGGGEVLAPLLGVFHFALPFVLLLSAGLQRHRGPLAAVAVLLVGMRSIGLVWVVVPGVGHGEVEVTFFERLLYLSAMIGLGGLWLGFYLWQLARWPLLPEYKPYAEAATHGAVTTH